VITEHLIHSFAHAALSPDPDLAVAALMIARLEYPDLDAGPYLDQLDALGREAQARVAAAEPQPGHTPRRVDPEQYARVIALNDYLFSELRFVGNAGHYEDPRNSFLNQVLERRTGIPITLALLYMEVARRADLHIEGINFPRHFLVRSPARHDSPYSEDLIIDVFRGGVLVDEAGCRELFHRAMGEEVTFETGLLARAAKPQILTRMLMNLKHVYVNMHSFPQARDVTELLLAVDPGAPTQLRDRGLLAYHLKDFSGALRDLQAYLRMTPTAALDDDDRREREQIWEHVKTLRRRVASLN
jgi:regulator of sirC expression with transglutaminase-like and TPR domain